MDERTTISQSELLELLGKRGHSCSERTLPGYLRAIMRELNPEDEDGFVRERVTIDDYRITVGGIEGTDQRTDHQSGGEVLTGSSSIGTREESAFFRI